MLSVNNFSFGSRVYLFFVLLLTVGIVESHAQYYSFAHYSIEDGLPQSSVNHIAQDQFGYLWIATSGGLSRFDGQNFENFGMQEGLSSSYITHILTTSTQQLAIATYSGLTIYDGHTFTPYSISNGEGKLLEVRQVFEHTDGRLLLLLPQNQLAFWSADTIEMIPVSSLLEEKYITGVVQNPDGTYWATTYDGDLLRFDGAAF
ncbi:MAG: two-component regulator propeller domain-containing protein [Cyclobacteriaceae bacterium]